MRATQRTARMIRSLGRGSIGRLLTTVLFFALSVVTVVIGVTGAIFTDTEIVGANIFSTGTLDISTAPLTAVVSFTAIAPGDQVTNPLTVTNDGSIQLRYSVSSTTTEDVLAAALDLTIKVGVTTCTNVGFTVDGTVISPTGDLGSTSGINLIGDPAQGADSGDRVLNPLASEVLCFNVSLPLSTGNSSQGVTTTADFTFQAEQTANN